MSSIYTTAFGVTTAALGIGAAEAIGRSNKLPAGTGALEGLFTICLHHAVQPAWTAYVINAGLNPVATAVLLVARIVIQAAVSSAVINQFVGSAFPIEKGTVVGSCSIGAYAISQFLVKAAARAAQA
ncbi:MAG: hypothetical protein Q8K75_05060 [Chlamydiales bacterium]|nr:hypothetical protein [Chlamydiales bacterium]